MIRKVVPLGFQQQEEIGEVTKVHLGYEIIDKP